MKKISSVSRKYVIHDKNASLRDSYHSEPQSESDYSKFQSSISEQIPERLLQVISSGKKKTAFSSRQVRMSHFSRPGLKALDSTHKIQNSFKKSYFAPVTKVPTTLPSLENQYRIPLSLQLLIQNRKYSLTTEQATIISKKKCCLKITISPKSTFRLSWDLLVIFLSLVHFILLSFLLGFSLPMKEMTIFMPTQNFILAVYLIDIFLNFRTSFHNQEGEIESSTLRIAAHYAKKGFLLDLISVIPFRLFGLHSLSFLSLLKLTRLLKVKYFIKRLSFSIRCKLSLKLFALSFSLPLIYHTFACMWGLIKSEQWIAPYLWLNINAIELPFSRTEEYFQSIHYSMMGGIAGGEMGPVTTQETIVAILFILLGSIINANAFAIMSGLIEQVNKEEVSFQDKLTTANTVMGSIALPLQMKRFVRHYLAVAEGTQQKQEEILSFLDKLSPSLNERVLVFIFARVIKNNRIFKKSLKDTADLNDAMMLLHQKSSTMGVGTLLRKWKNCVAKKQTAEAALALVTSFITPVLTQPEEVIVEYNSKPDSMYFIQGGSCVVHRRSLFKRTDRPIALLKCNDHFGEISMIFDCPTFARVMSSKFSLLGRLNKHNFARISRAFPGFRRVIKDEVLLYRSKWKKRLEDALRQTPYFSSLGAYLMSKILYSCRLVQFDEGQKLYSEGEEAKGLWVIITGRVVLEFKTQGLQVPLKVLKAGTLLNYDYLSFSSLTNDLPQRKPLPISARAASFVTCAFLSFHTVARVAHKGLQLQKQLFMISRAIKMHPCRPYVLDYYVTKTRWNGKFKKREQMQKYLTCLKEQESFVERSEQQSILERQSSADSNQHAFLSQFTESMRSCNENNVAQSNYVRRCKLRSSITSNISVEKLLQTDSCSDRLSKEKSYKLVYPGKRNGLFKFKNSVATLILTNRKLLKEMSLIHRIQ